MASRYGRYGAAPVRNRSLPVPPAVAVVVAVLALLAAACGDDGGADGDGASSTTAGAPAATADPGPPTTVAGPTEGQVACAGLAERYVRRARALFTQEGTPSDAVVDRARARFAEFDEIAGAAGCGAEYVTGICEGLDELTHDGVLVLFPLTTAQCL